MRLTVPHMANLYIGTKAMAQWLGIDFVVPPPTSQRTLSLGVKYSPETVCLPFKLTLGNMIEALERGADTILMLGRYGPCRFGYYHKIQEEILRDLGFNFQMINMDSGVRQMIKNATNGASLWDVVKAFRFGITKIKILDSLEQLVHKKRAVEQVTGQTNQIYKEALEAIDNAPDYLSLNRVRREYQQKLKNLPTKSQAAPLTIGITGEVYVVTDQFANMDIEEELGKLGVEVRRSLSITEWVRTNPLVYLFRLNEKDKSHRAAIPYLHHHLGGDGWRSVGEKVLYANKWDGLVHLEPFGCLPEIMARNIMPAAKKDLPVLNLTYDEHTGKAGVVTRLEAFVEMIKRKKRANICA